MKAARIVYGVGLWLLTFAVRGQAGLKGDYYTGTNFEHKVFTRIDPQISFDWSRNNPGTGIPYSFYSIRWTGKLRVPATGEYKFYAKVDDGIRVWVGGKKVMESWQLNNSNRFVGVITLEAGRFYDLRVDYFNDINGGEIELYWQRPDARKAVTDRFAPPGELITAQYFTQKAPPVPVSKPPILALTPAKTVPRKTVPPPLPKPVPARNPTTKKNATDSLTSPNVSVRASITEPPTNIPPDTSFNLRQRNIPFEQSNYILLPEASAELDQLITVLKKHPDWRISVAGYTDNVGDPRLNLALSEFRARVVANYLRQRGIADERMTTAGYGDNSPYSDNETEEGRSQNRRVVIKRQ